MLTPPNVIRIRQDICKRNNCAGGDYTDPCAACPNGHWCAYSHIGCDGKPELPSLLQQAKNVGKAAVDVVKHGVKHGIKHATQPVSTDEQVARLAICGDCEFFLPEKGKCAKCGCHLAFKTMLAAWHCPIKRW